jgi:hypothetical protein
MKWSSKEITKKEYVFLYTIPFIDVLLKLGLSQSEKDIHMILENAELERFFKTNWKRK